MRPLLNNYCHISAHCNLTSRWENGPIITRQFPFSWVDCHRRCRWSNCFFSFVLMLCQRDEWTRSMRAGCGAGPMPRRTCTCNFLGSGAECGWGILQCTPLSAPIDRRAERLEGSTDQSQISSPVLDEHYGNFFFFGVSLGWGWDWSRALSI